MPPFDAAMARRHKKGLSARQVRQWVAVARSTYDGCIADGTSAATCEARAIRAANGVTGTPARATNQRRIVINTVVTVPPARVVLNRQEYLTAPAVLIVEGVLNHGLILAEELHPQQWDGVPVVLGHPVDTTGLPHSARQPEVLATCGMGHVYHSRLGAGTRQGHPVASLAAELWINLADAVQCGPAAAQAIAMLETQTPLEISTAFYSETEQTTGSFYGAVYHEVHRNLQPDHLALLPNDIGACSLADGCGAPRLNHATLTYTSTKPAGCTCPGMACTCHEGDMPMTTQETPATGWRRFVQVLREFVASEEPAPVVPETPPPESDEEPDEEQEDEEEAAEDALAPSEDALHVQISDADARESIYGCLAREMGQDMTPFYIDSLDTTTQTFTFRQGERLRRRRWQMQDGVLVLDPDTEDVQRSTSYTPVPTLTQEEQQSMASNSKRWVDALITHAQTSWQEDDRTTLDAMPEAVLIRMVQDAQRLPVPPQPRDGYLSVHEALDNVEPEEREAVSAAIQTYKRHKDKLIEILTTNQQNPFTREELQSMTAERLEKLVTMGGDLLPGQQPERSGQSYAGRRMPPIRLVTEEDEIPPPPNTLALVVERQKALGLR